MREKKPASVNRKREFLLQAMIGAQQQSGENYLSQSAVRTLAEAFDMSEGEVMDTATFYREISLKPRGKYVIRLCSSPCCHFSGGDNITTDLCTLLHIDIGQTTKDRMFTLEETGCIGACDEAPAMLVNEKHYGNLTLDKVRKIINGLKEGEDQ